MSTQSQKSERDDEIFTAAFDLPYESRKNLVERLLETLEATDKMQHDIEKAWIEEARCRFEQYKAGKAEVFPKEEVFKKLRKRL